MGKLLNPRTLNVGARIRGIFGDIDPLNKVPFKRATSRDQAGLRRVPFKGSP